MQNPDDDVGGLETEVERLANGSLAGSQAATLASVHKHIEDQASSKQITSRSVRFQVLTAFAANAMRNSIVVQRIGFTVQVLAIGTPAKHEGRASIIWQFVVSRAKVEAQWSARYRVDIYRFPLEEVAVEGIQALFPTAVMVAKGVLVSNDLEQLRRQVVAELEQVNSHDAKLNHSRILPPDRTPYFRRLASLVEAQLALFGEALLGERLNWFVKEVWVNRLGHDGYQATHVHANSIISGVFYLTGSDPSANLVFERGLGGGQFIFSNFHEGSDVTAYNAARWQVPQIDAGDLILFPSHLLHGVPRNEGGERISISFNAIPDRLESWGYGIRLSPLRDA